MEDETEKISDKQFQLFVDHIDRKLENLECPLCGEDDFSAAGRLLTGVVVNPDSGSKTTNGSYPYVHTTCKNCLYVLQFAAVPLGLFDLDEEEQESE